LSSLSTVEPHHGGRRTSASSRALTFSNSIVSSTSRLKNVEPSSVVTVILYSGCEQGVSEMMEGEQTPLLSCRSRAASTRARAKLAISQGILGPDGGG
jgi:hypothetical protein